MESNRKEHDYEIVSRYKNMGYGEYINGEFVEYEDMTEEQLMEIHEQDAEEWRKEYHAEWLETLEEEY